ncbi:MAG: hypothetical protein ACP5XB_26740, partial [Isosphaeraceae bacterium]
MIYLRLAVPSVFSSRLVCAAAVVATWTFVLANAPASEGAWLSHPPVEGDAALFDAVADAYEACLGRYPHGTMEVFAERGELEPLRPDVRIECKFEWLGANHRVKGRFTNFLTAKDGKVKEATDEIETVLSEKSYQVYDVTLHHLRICSPNAGLIPLTKLQP